MSVTPIQALQAANHMNSGVRPLPGVLLAGATGVLGNEVLRRLAGAGGHGPAWVLAREPIRAGLRHVQTMLVPGDAIHEWALPSASIGVVMFEPPRLFYQRERALWTPDPQQLPALARWMRAGGVTTLAVVLPHAQGRLPDALKSGLASLDEQAVAALGFERVIFVRSAQKPPVPRARSWAEQLAQTMLSIMRLMVPASEQPVRASRVAELVALSLQLAPPGIHVAAPELVWRAAQGDLRGVATRWLTQ